MDVVKYNSSLSSLGFDGDCSEPNDAQRAADAVVDPAEPPKAGVTTLYIGRHGATEEDELHQFCGQTNSPLTPVGLENAKHLAIILSQYEFSQVFCSDLDRARETAQVVAGDRPVTPLYSLRTWGIGSDLSGQNKTPMLENLKTFYIRNPNVVPTGDNAESINQAQARQSGGLWAVLAQTPVGTANTIIAHSAMFKVIGKTFNDPLLRVGPGGLIRIEVAPDGVVAVTVLFIGRITMDAPDIQAEATTVLRYAPDQPRDDHGKFGEVFHGTTKEAADKILKNGLKTSQTIRGKGAFATDSKRMALEYAVQRTEEHAQEKGWSNEQLAKSTVSLVVLDGKAFDKVKADPLNAGAKWDIFKSGKAVPAEAVKRVEHYTFGAIAKRTVVPNAKFGGITEVKTAFGKPDSVSKRSEEDEEDEVFVALDPTELE